MPNSDWIDECGKWREARSPYLELTGPGHYVFRHLGLVKVCAHHPRTIQWDLKQVNPDSMLAARKWLAEQVGIRPVTLVYYFGGWFVEQVNSGLQALDRIDRLSSYRDAPPPRRSYEKRVNFKSAVFARPIRLSYDLWQKDNGRLHEDDKPAMAALAQHLVVYDSRPRRNAYRRIHVGHQSYLAQIGTTGEGEKRRGARYAVEAGDGELGEAFTQSCKKVIEANQPAFHHLCARVQVENRPHRWLQMERGLFPFEMPDGAPVLVSVCAPRRAVDIQFCP